MRALHYLALLLLIGAAVFSAAVGEPSRRVVAAACGLGLTASLAAIPLQRLLGSAGGLNDALDGGTLSGSLDTRTGTACRARLGVSRPRRPER